MTHIEGGANTKPHINRAPDEKPHFDRWANGSTVTLTPYKLGPPGPPGPNGPTIAGGSDGDVIVKSAGGIATGGGAPVLKGELMLTTPAAGTSDDTTVLATLFTAARAYGATVRFTPGQTFTTSAALDPTGCIVDMRGSTLQAKSGVTAPNLFAPTGAFTLIGGTLNGKVGTDSGSSSNSCGIFLSTSTGWTGQVLVQGTTFSVWQKAVAAVASTAITDAVNAYVGRILVDNITVTAATYGVHTNKLQGVAVRNCHITGATTDGIWSNLCNRYKAHGNNVTGSGGHGIVVLCSLDATVSDNVANSNGSGGVTMGGNGSNTPMLNPTVTGNVCRNNTTSGVTVDPTVTGGGGVPQPTHGTVSGNVCSGNGIHGITLTAAQYLSVTGNNCYGNTTNGISVGAADISLSGNICSGNGNYGIRFSGNAGSPNYGHHRVGINYVANNTTGGYFLEDPAYIPDVIFAPAVAGSTTPPAGLTVGSTYEVANTTTVTTIWSPTAWAAGSLVAGTTTLSLRINGTIDCKAASGSMFMRPLINGVNPGSITVAASQTGANTNLGWYIDLMIYVDVLGASGKVSVVGMNTQLAAGGATWTPITQTSLANTVNLTTGLAVTVALGMNTADAANKIRLEKATLRQVA